MRALMSTTAAALAVTLSAGGVLAQAVQPGDGAELARKLCSNCHGTDAAGTGVSRPAEVPSFAAIANNPRTTPDRLASAIILPHPEMPGIGLTRAETRAIIDYIMSLKK
jgi:mono/diheme cytochrome c family protein